MLSIQGLFQLSPSARKNVGDQNSQVTSVVQRLEKKIAPAKQSITMALGANGVLAITGTNKDDVIDITPGDKPGSVIANGREFQNVNALNIKTFNGPDSIRITSGVNAPAHIETGNGNDSIYALGKAADYIDTGKGRNVIVTGEANVPGEVDNVVLGKGKLNDNVFLNWNDIVSGVTGNDSVQRIDQKPVITDPDPTTVEEILYIDGNFAPDPFEVLFQGDTLSLEQSSIQTVDGGVFYRAILNGVDRGDFRANGKIIIQVPGGENGGNVYIDPALKTFLKSQEPLPGQEIGGEGWLQFKGIDSTALPALPQSLSGNTLDILFARKSIFDSVLAV